MHLRLIFLVAAGGGMLGEYPRGKTCQPIGACKAAP